MGFGAIAKNEVLTVRISARVRIRNGIQGGADCLATVVDRSRHTLISTECAQVDDLSAQTDRDNQCRGRHSPVAACFESGLPDSVRQPGGDGTHPCAPPRSQRNAASAAGLRASPRTALCSFRSASAAATSMPSPSIVPDMPSGGGLPYPQSVWACLLWRLFPFAKFPSVKLET